MSVERTAFYQPDELIGEARKAIAAIEGQGETIDYLTFVPDGEPTLDSNLGKEIYLAKETGHKVAVITNGSLLWDPSVREGLSVADAVSVKVDAADKATWRAIDRPHRALDFDEVLNGIRIFADEYNGTLLTETMLIGGVNDGTQTLGSTAAFIENLTPKTAYVSIPTRPPAEQHATPPQEQRVTEAYALYSARIPHVELLTGYEGNAFSSTGDARTDLLSITAVHPMREDAVRDLLAKSGASWGIVNDLLGNGELVAHTYRGKRYYLRRFHPTT
jgi:wyosine [tRNA(Phe)-imidazoG37] synthetase (radical SAM superfamily)